MKYVAITGAYGGMGYKTVRELVKNGYTVFALDKVVKDKEENVIPVEVDVTNIDNVKLALKKISNPVTKYF